MLTFALIPSQIKILGEISKYCMKYYLLLVLQKSYVVVVQKLVVLQKSYLLLVFTEILHTCIPDAFTRFALSVLEALANSTRTT